MKDISEGWVKRPGVLTGWGPSAHPPKDRPFMARNVANRLFNPPPFFGLLDFECRWNEKKAYWERKAGRKWVQCHFHLWRELPVDDASGA